jgi:hypothetical protein
VALALALAVLVLVESLAALGLAVTVGRVRLAAAEAEAVDAGIAARSVLAEARVTYADALGALAEGEQRALGRGSWGVGWSWQADADRRDGLIRVTVAVERPGPGGVPRAAARATLLLSGDPADTVRVLMRAPRS